MKKQTEQTSNRASIGNQLLITYFLLALLALFTASVAWFGFISIDKGHRKVVNESTPLIIEAYKLSELVNRSVNLSSALATVDKQAQLDELRLELQFIKRNIENEITLLRVNAFKDMSMATVEEFLTELNDSIAQQDTLITERVRLKKANSERLQKALKNVDKINSALRPILADLEVVQSGQESALKQTVDDLEQAVIQLQKVLAELPIVISKSRLLNLKTSYTLHLRSIIQGILDLDDLKLRKKITDQTDILSEQLDSGSTGLFASVEQLIALEEALHEKSQNNKVLAQQLSEHISALITSVNTAIQEDYSQANQARSNAQYLILFLVVLTITLPLLVVYFYLKPKIIQRLEKLAQSTSKISSGKLDTTIETSGNDELASMAQALDQFKTDLLRKKESEEALSKTLLQLKIQKQALDQFAIVAETNAKGIITYANRQFCKVAGYDNEELIGKNHKEIVNSGFHSKAFWKEMWGTIKSNRIWRGDICNRTKNHDIYWVDTTIVPVIDNHEDDKPDRFLAVRFLITDKKQVENALKKSEERYELAVKGSSVGLWDWDVNNNELYWSPRFKEIVQVTDEDFSPRLNDFEDRLHPDDHDRTMEAFNAHLHQAKPYDVEYRIRREDSSYVWVHARGQAIWDPSGKPLRVSGSVDDITSRKETEDALKDTIHKLKEANDEVAQFSYRTSHDLKAPLITTKGYCDLLLRGVKNNNFDTVENDVTVILKNTEKLIALIEDILVLSRAEHTTEDFVEFRIDDAVEDIKSQLREMFDQSGVTLTYSNSMSEAIMTRKNLFFQVLMNLTSNAIKYNHPDREAFVKIETFQQETHWKIVIEDNGLGIPEKHQSKLFDMFTRFHPDIAFGSGLGLYLVKKNIDKLGGDITFDSSDSGTRFEILLPIITDTNSQ